MAKRVNVAAVADVPDGEGRVVEAGEHTLAVFNVKGRFFAIDNRCVHRGGPLGEGPVDDHTVMCPWHGWRFDVTTGANVKGAVCPARSENYTGNNPHNPW